MVLPLSVKIKKNPHVFFYFCIDLETAFLGKFDNFAMKEAQEVNVLSGIS